MKKHGDQKVYGSFWVGSNEFALDTSIIKEVVNEPESYHNIPKTAGFVLGLFPLRNMVLPTIDFRGFLQLSSPGDAVPSQQKVVVLETKDHLLGLRFERMGEIFKSTPDQLRAIELKNENCAIEGAFLYGESKRLIQVLSQSYLLSVPNLPLLRRTEEVSKNKYKKRSQAISFSVGDAKFSVGIDILQETIMLSSIESPMFSFKSCVGDFVLRDKRIPLVDFRKLLDLGENCAVDNNIKTNRILILKLSSGLIGVLVSSVDDIVNFYDEDVVLFNGHTQLQSGELVRGSIRSRHGDVLLFDSGRLAQNSELSSMAECYSVLEEKDSSKTLENKGEKNTYILFSLEKDYAINIQEVREIVEYPKELLPTPDSSSAVSGVLNLRGKLVTIVDSYKLYDIPEPESKALKKVLIFEKNQQCFGLAVTAINSIVSICKDDLRKLPVKLNANIVGSFQSEQAEYFKCQLRGNELSPFVIDIERVFSRLNQKNEGKVLAVS